MKLGVCLLLLAGGCGAPFTAAGPDLLEREDGAPDVADLEGGPDGGDGGGGQDALADSEGGQVEVGVEACTLVTHSDGFSDTWRDCEPLGTRTAAEAQDACASALPRVAPDGGSACWAFQCPNGPAACLSYPDGTTQLVWACWVYAGPSAGLAGASHGLAATAGCPQDGGVTWQ